MLLLFSFLKISPGNCFPPVGFARPPRPHPALEDSPSYLQSATVPKASRKTRFAGKATQPASSGGKPRGYEPSIHSGSARTRAWDSRASRGARELSVRFGPGREGRALTSSWAVGREPQPIHAALPLGHALSPPAAGSPRLTSPGCWSQRRSLPRLRSGTQRFSGCEYGGGQSPCVPVWGL